MTCLLPFFVPSGQLERLTFEMVGVIVLALAVPRSAHFCLSTALTKSVRVAKLSPKKSSRFPLHLFLRQNEKMVKSYLYVCILTVRSDIF